MTSIPQKPRKVKQERKMKKAGESFYQLDSTNTFTGKQNRLSDLIGEAVLRV